MLLLNTNRNTLVCYEDIRDVFVSRKESVFPMEMCLDMGNQFIYNVKTPVNIDQGVNKGYVDNNFLKLTGGCFTGRLYLPTNSYVMQGFFIEQANPYVKTSFNMVYYKIINLATSADNTDAANKAYIDNKFSKIDGSTPMSGNFKMGNNIITGLTTTATLTGESATPKDYVLAQINHLLTI